MPDLLDQLKELRDNAVAREREAREERKIAERALDAALGNGATPRKRRRRRKRTHTPTGINAVAKQLGARPETVRAVARELGFGVGKGGRYSLDAAQAEAIAKRLPSVKEQSHA